MRVSAGLHGRWYLCEWGSSEEWPRRRCANARGCMLKASHRRTKARPRPTATMPGALFFLYFFLRLDGTSLPEAFLPRWCETVDRVGVAWHPNSIRRSSAYSRDSCEYGKHEIKRLLTDNIIYVALRTKYVICIGWKRSRKRHNVVIVV